MDYASAIKLLTCVESVILGMLIIRKNPESRSSLLFTFHLFFVAATAFVEFVTGQKEGTTVTVILPEQYLRPISLP